VFESCIPHNHQTPVISCIPSSNFNLTWQISSHRIQKGLDYEQTK
jgi:hypothetical protein